MTSRAFLSSSVVVLSLAVAGCSCDSGTRGPRRDGGPGTSDLGPATTNEVGAQCVDRIDNDRDGLLDCVDPDCVAIADCAAVDAGPRPDAPLEGCASSRHDGENGVAPVDIVWVIDDSGSMGEEGMLVQTNMNRFADRMLASGITDYHVVLLTLRSFVTIPPPLGTDPEHFLHLDVDVQSNDGFEQAINWLMPGTPTGYGHFLRPGAALHYVFVTDDESDMQSTAFRSTVRSALGRDFFGHAIASPVTGPPLCPFPGFPCIPAPGCMGMYGDAPAGGQEYIDLVTDTGGVFASICEDNWTGVFDRLLASIAIATPLPCNFLIPEPPAGEVFDRSLVNVVYTADGSPTGVTLPRSDGCTNPDGWYYDNPDAPTEILLCSGSCGTVAGSTGSIDIELGCETVVF